MSGPETQDKKPLNCRRLGRVLGVRASIPDPDMLVSEAMSTFLVTEQKEKELVSRMAELGLGEEDLEEKFLLGSGKGGQKVNKTSSCVYLRHGPSGLEVKCQRTRSQALNRFFARRELCDRFEERVRGEKSRRQQEQEKIRRQKRRRSRRSKQRMLEDKRRQGEKKDLRKSIRSGADAADG